MDPEQDEIVAAEADTARKQIEDSLRPALADIEQIVRSAQNG